MDSVPKEIFTELEQEFQNLKCIQTNKNKPREEIIENSVSKLDGILSKLSKDSSDFSKILSMIACMMYERAKISLHANSFKKSKEYLEKGLDLIKGDIDNPQISFVYLRIVNYLAYVESRIGDLEKAKVLLEAVVNKEFSSEPHVYSSEDLFSNKKSDPSTNKVKVQKLMINNMQMLGWIYGKQGSGNRYADMIHRSLQKELDLNDGDPIQWATRCYRLASLFLAQDKWEDARYHLTAAQGVLDPLEVGLLPNPLLFKSQADLARVWVNYGLQLYGVSKKFILDKIWDESEENPKHTNSAENPEAYKFCRKPEAYKFCRKPKAYKFSRKPEAYETCEARELFSHTHKWLKRARLYYTLRDYPLQYVNIILELSELYRYLAFYEKDVDSQYEVHKKRYETLETLSAILREVRPSCYTAVSVEILREIMEVQIELMNLNLKKIYNPYEERITEERICKNVCHYVAENIITIQEEVENENHEKDEVKIDQPSGVVDHSNGKGEGKDFCISDITAHVSRGGAGPTGIVNSAEKPTPTAVGSRSINLSLSATGTLTI
ncbi:hypothetical protein JTB14_021770 [Gonioctena quinquepunctata]|nr:hypothetical protein JTB14_021770 [Gonioctena quinquepunctata]